MRSLKNPRGEQEFLVNLVMGVLKRKDKLGLVVAGCLLSLLGDSEILQIFHIHDQIADFIDAVAYFCEAIGKQITIGQCPPIPFLVSYMHLCRITSCYGCIFTCFLPYGENFG